MSSAIESLVPTDPCCRSLAHRDFLCHKVQSKRVAYCLAISCVGVLRKTLNVIPVLEEKVRKAEKNIQSAPLLCHFYGMSLSVSHQTGESIGTVILCPPSGQIIVWHLADMLHPLGSLFQPANHLCSPSILCRQQAKQHYIKTYIFPLLPGRWSPISPP